MKSVLGRSHGFLFMYTEVTNRNEAVFIKYSMKYKHDFFWPRLQRVRKTEKIYIRPSHYFYVEHNTDLNLQSWGPHSSFNRNFECRVETGGRS